MKCKRSYVYVWERKNLETLNQINKKSVFNLFLSLMWHLKKIRHLVEPHLWQYKVSAVKFINQNQPNQNTEKVNHISEFISKLKKKKIKNLTDGRYMAKWWVVMAVWGQRGNGRFWLWSFDVSLFTPYFKLCVTIWLLWL